MFTTDVTGIGIVIQTQTSVASNYVLQVDDAMVVMPAM